MPKGAVPRHARNVSNLIDQNIRKRGDRQFNGGDFHPDLREIGYTPDMGERFDDLLDQLADGRHEHCDTRSAPLRVFERLNERNHLAESE